ncbi:MAG TPA: acylphosphatase [Oscillatoriales cyanobacterium M4454_W2019_049]|nr:acylphosphatase [Oscillatoriales cyanobacterium M4454_W2019_049]
MEPFLKSVRVRISGRVQGVGYRFWTQDEACRLGLAGWVRNLPDGRVEAVFEGDADAIDRMIRSCRSGPPAARVSDVTIEDGVHQGLSGFEIRR